MLLARRKVVADSINLKCDEARPTCANCQRAGVGCTYEQLKGSPAQSASPAASPASNPVYQDHSLTFDLLDLSIMHHYTVSTSLGLFAGKGSQEIWQITLPIQARSNPLLMHGLLALASMDLARTCPAERQLYATRALAHQSAGTRLFRTMLEQNHPSDVIFIFSMILPILAFAFPQACDEPPDLDGILDLFSLLRGCKIVWMLNPELVSASPVAHWVKTAIAGRPMELKQEVERRFAILRHRLNDPVDILAANQLVDFVQGDFATEPDGVQNLGYWPSMVSDAFWLRLQNHELESLLVLAYYSVILGGYRRRWWTANWDTILLYAIDKALSDSDKKAVDWDLGVMIEFAQSYKDA